MSNLLYQWIQGVYSPMVFENKPVSIKFPCSKCGSNRPTSIKMNGSMEIEPCPCKVGKEAK